MASPRAPSSEAETRLSTQGEVSVVRLTSAGPRVGAALTAVVLVAGAGVTAALLWPGNGAAEEAGDGDAFAQAPNCSLVDEDIRDAAVPEGTVQRDEQGPLDGGQRTMCAWSSRTDGDDGVRGLAVDFEVYWSDSGGADPTDGAHRAERRLDSALPEAPFPEAAEALGSDPRAGPAATGSGREVAFRRDNLVVWVWFGGVRSDSGEGIPGGEAHDTARTVAEEIATRL
ncbi:hypothetical protein RIF23_13210 [Lipingzhangella sp. LS1_29]|uniref:DUF3558 domain-containing protein n=1 Tax=Lipingzhangella rawalii TaxID=2055835 RepID=A0ABU2H7I5_9ACTN|nr:hypothetical protein [Lipingzhangella rawalii]MDS1271255.1 hypothetical protein [Lipingzhangella rawalii]